MIYLRHHGDNFTDILSLCVPPHDDWSALRQFPWLVNRLKHSLDTHGVESLLHLTLYAGQGKDGRVSALHIFQDAIRSRDQQ